LTSKPEVNDEIENPALMVV